MSDSLLQQGLELMYFGMGTVVVFLSLLVLVTGAMSSVVARFERPIMVDQDKESQVSPVVVAAITAAIHQHRHKH